MAARVANLLPAASFVTALVQEGQKLFAYQISMKYLTTRLRYYYFRFQTTNGRRIGILLPVSILTYLS